MTQSFTSLLTQGFGNLDHMDAPCHWKQQRAYYFHHSDLFLIDLQLDKRISQPQPGSIVCICNEKRWFLRFTYIVTSYTYRAFQLLKLTDNIIHLNLIKYSNSILKKHILMGFRFYIHILDYFVEPHFAETAFWHMSGINTYQLCTLFGNDRGQFAQADLAKLFSLDGGNYILHCNFTTVQYIFTMIEIKA